jgi:hypothetical protein
MEIEIKDLLYTKLNDKERQIVYLCKSKLYLEMGNEANLNVELKKFLGNNNLKIKKKRKWKRVKKEEIYYQ